MRTTGELSSVTREADLAAMAEAPLDVLVIGGGITGAGIALDAAARGYCVGLVERGDFASGTSSRSTKLAHGGIRYLPQFDVALVREGLRERGRLLRNAPHLVHPLSFLLPLYASSRHPVGIPIAPPGGVGLTMILDLGLSLYDALAGRKRIGPHRRLTRAEVIARAPGLVAQGVKSGFVYYDGQTDDSRLTLAVLRSAAERGAALVSYCEVVAFQRDGSRVVGAYIRDTLPGQAEDAPAQPRLIRARHIVNATGVWADQLEKLAGDPPLLRIAPSKGAHLVFTREALSLGEEAIVLPETDDGRIIFIVPWRSRALVGTTDDEVASMSDPVATAEEIDYLLAHLNRYARRSLTRADIVGAYAGYRPLLRFRKGHTSGRLSRTHAIVESAGGLLTISGGKLTAYRVMAEEVVDRIDQRERRTSARPTRQLRLCGAVSWPEARNKLAALGARLGLDAPTLDHLATTYGSDSLVVLMLIEQDSSLAARLIADLPYLRAEVVYSCRAELALTLQDVLARRTHISIEDRRHGTEIAEAVAALMAAELGWAPAYRDEQIASYNAYARHQAGPLAE